jgi:hypothetical protein
VEDSKTQILFSSPTNKEADELKDLSAFRQTRNEAPIQWHADRTRGAVCHGFPRAVHGCPAPSINAPSASTKVAPRPAPKCAPKLAPWFASFCATSSATFSAHPIDKMLSHSSEFLPRPCAVTNPVTQPTPDADPALPTTVKITGRPGSAPGWENPQIASQGAGQKFNTWTQISD